MQLVKILLEATPVPATPDTLETESAVQVGMLWEYFT